MKFPDTRTGLSTMGLTGIVVLAGVIFAGLNPWWLLVSGFFILSAIGLESGRNNNS